jgi:hypothetical protein
MNSARAFLNSVIPSKAKESLREQVVSMNVRHLRGPRTVELSNNEAAVTCVLRNAQYHLEAFINHYLQMGFRHIFLLDNGSSDQTLSIARSYDSVSICQSNLPVSSYQRLLKRYIARRSVRGGWCLDADVDEFFDYPLSGSVSLPTFLSYLNDHRYTALLTQLLDMFSDQPLSQLASGDQDNIKSVYQYFDTSDITRTDYRGSAIALKYGYANRLADSRIQLYWGGIRKTLYGNDCLLSKHSLFRRDESTVLFPHVHFVNRASVADLTGVMLHYKLTHNALASAVQNRDNFTENSGSYNAFIDILRREPDLKVRRGTAQRYLGATALVEDGFLLASSAYKEYAANRTVNDQTMLGAVRGER